MTRRRRWPWPRRNTPEQISERQELLRALPHWDPRHDFVWEWPQPPAELAGMLEALTAHIVLPVSVVGPLRVSLGRYHVDEKDGSLVEEGRQVEEVYVPLAHTEGGLSDSMQRGIVAVLEGEPVRTHVVRDRMTRDSCFLFRTTADALTFARWVTDNVPAMRHWLHDPANPLYEQRIGGVARLSSHARLWEVDTHVLGPACHVLYRYTTGEACGPNLITRNSYALNTDFVGPRFTAATGIAIERVLLEANMGGDKKPSAQYFTSGGHGKTVLAEVTVREETLRRVLRTSARDLVALEHLGLHGGQASGMQSVAFTPASAVAALFATTGQDLGMVGTSSMAHDVLEPVEGGIHLATRFPGLEVGTVGGGTGLPHARAFLSLLGCRGPGSAHRLAQIMAAAALCLELSASAAASRRGSENFAAAHLTQSGRS
ncbi:MAG TPA: 3-hydroxy-3-methylglutaryl-CoA reductase [Candidatus Dormibacteraeota bacterium]